MAKHPSDLELRAQLAKKPPTRRTGLPVGRRRRTRTSPRRTARSGARGVSFPLPTQLRMRQSAVKIAYSRNTKSQSKQSWAAHGRYLAREGAQREGGKGLGFNAERADLDLATTLQGWQAAGDARLFKLIVSPENGAQLDLTAHARALVRQMEHDLATRLDWVAIDHHNTGQPHVHLVLRGRDAAGDDLRLDRDYIRSGIRVRSQELVTQALGWRSQSEISAARDRQVTQLRFTTIDRSLLRRADADRVVTYEGRVPTDPFRQAGRLQELQRLGFLTSLGLAEKVGSQTWLLSPQLEPALRQYQLTRDILKSHAQVRDYQQLTPLSQEQPGLRLHGQAKARGTTMPDDDRMNAPLSLHEQTAKPLRIVSPDRQQPVSWPAGQLCDR